MKNIIGILMITLVTASAVEVDRPPALAILDQAIGERRAGRELTDAMRTDCHSAFLDLTRRLERENHVVGNTAFADPERTDYYILATKMALIDPAKHGGWPVRSALRLSAYPELKSRITGGHDPILDFAIVLPAIELGDLARAAESYENLKQGDPFLWGQLTEVMFLSLRQPLWYIDYYRSKGMREAAEKALSDLRKFCFPEGMQAIDVEALRGAPKGGALFVTESERLESYRLKAGDVVVGLDGYRVDNMRQYFYVRELDRGNPVMKVVVWNGERYAEMSVTVPARLFGVRMSDYRPAEVPPIP